MTRQEAITQIKDTIVRACVVQGLALMVPDDYLMLLAEVHYDHAMHARDKNEKEGKPQ